MFFFVYKALEKWLSLTNEQESPRNGTQKIWTQPVFVKTAQNLISRMDDKRSSVFNAHQGKFGYQWLNVVPFKNLGLNLDDQQLRISIGLLLGIKICVAHTCHCGRRVERAFFYGLYCTKSAGRFSRHATLNSLIKHTLGSLDLASMLEPRRREQYVSAKTFRQKNSRRFGKKTLDVSANFSGRNVPY